ncbi:MAG: pantoate--beta-alanine ligase [Thermoanaerobaculia bacterium]|nr:pantoate--beta-alanine ligase [Thermoanaerobaculia bacterium]
MKTAEDLSRLRELVGEARGRGLTVGLVPTMGALHDGHLSLVRLARSECGFVVVSIFVNPLQFGPGEDLTRYPRAPERDRRLLEETGVDVTYAPDPAGFYPPDFSTAVEVGAVTEGGEGAARPGHFRGVATVVAKLFLQAQPDAAFFGRKDLQQVAVVRRMIRDLDFPIRLVVGEIVREPDGLAMSSRNAYLSAGERALAAAFPKILNAEGRRAAPKDEARVLEERVRRRLEEAGLAVDYVEVVDPATMARAAQVASGNALAAAVRAGKTRLLDNVLLRGETQ